MSTPPDSTPSGTVSVPSHADHQTAAPALTDMHDWATGRDWEKLKGEGRYEDDFFFVSQLFEENWKPRSTI